MSDTTNETIPTKTDSPVTDTSSTESVLSTIRAARDSISVDKVFGDPYKLDGVTVIPVARVGGGAGGGGGEGGEHEVDGVSGGESGSDAGREGSGFGTGFGMRAAPVGVYEIRDREAVWKPAVDVNRLIKGFQVLVAIIAICFTLIRLRQQ